MSLFEEQKRALILHEAEESSDQGKQEQDGIGRKRPYSLEIL
jgi:hypothetical protein